MKEIDLTREKLTKIYFSYAVPAVIAACVFSAYSLTDVVFISRVCGDQALSAIEICYPLLCIFSCVSVVVGTGGNVLCGIAVGKRNHDSANSIFTTVTLLISGASLLFLFAICCFTKRFATLLGADDTVIEYVCDYLLYCGIFAPFYMLSGWFFLAVETAGNPGLAMLANIISTLGNIFLDWLFIIVFKWGVSGASLASGISAVSSTMIIFIYFISGKPSLQFGKATFNVRMIGQVLCNGLSEGISSVSTGIVTFIYNIVIMKVAGSAALADFTVALTLINFFGSLMIGASQGISPVVSVNFGARNKQRVKKALHVFIGYGLILSITVCILLTVFYSDITKIFLLEDNALSWYITKAYIPVLFLSPICIVIVSYFTAINNAKMSAILSIVRSLILRTMMVMIMLWIFGIDGVWFAATISELFALTVCCIVYKIYQNKTSY